MQAHYEHMLSRTRQAGFWIPMLPGGCGGSIGCRGGPGLSLGLPVLLYPG